MVQLFDFAQVLPRVEDLLDVVDLDAAGLRELNRVDLLFCEAVLLLVFLLESHFLLSGKLVALPYDAARLSDCLFSGIFVIQLLDVQM